MSPPVPYGHVRLTCAHPHADLLLLLGPEAPKITAGTGGWEVTARPRQVGMTTWAGVEPFQLTLGVMLDGAGRSVEPTLRELVTVARGDDDSPPGALKLAGIAQPAHDVRWVVEGLEFADPILARNGERTRQPLTLTLREYVDPSYLPTPPHALDSARRKTKVIRARKGDTPVKLARRHHVTWTDLRRLNPTLVRKANQALKTGTKLRCPVAEQRPTKRRR